jgi:serine protease AprX
MNIGHKSRNEKPKSQAVNWGGRSLNLLVVLALLWTPLFAVRAASDEPLRVDPNLLQLAQEHPDDVFHVIVQREVKNKDLPDDDPEVEVEKEGGKVGKRLTMIESFSAELTGKKIIKLAKRKKVRWISLDAPLFSTATGDPTVRDEFASASFSNNNGTQTWAGNWTETGDDNKPGSGSVKIASGQLQLMNKNRTFLRQVNLAGAASATLSFQYKRSGLDDANDYIAIQVSANGGSAWTELGRFAGSGTDSAWQTASYNITGYAAANTTIRFATSSSLGSSDILNVDNVQIEYALPTPTPSPTSTSTPTPTGTSAPTSAPTATPAPTDPLATAGIFTARDEFSTASYSNNNGTANWASDWVEVDSLNGGATSGNLKVQTTSTYCPDGTNCLYFDPATLNNGLTRSIDLSNVSNAFLTYSYNATELDTSETAEIRVQIKDAANAWQTLATFRSQNNVRTITANVGFCAGNPSGLCTHDLLPYRNTDPAQPTEIRLIVTAANDNQIMRWDNIQIVYSLPNAYVRTIGAHQLWQYLANAPGQGVTVAIVDSGIANHADLESTGGSTRIVASVNFNNASTNTNDEFGHGTHVAGIAGGNGALSDRVRVGAGTHVNLINVKVTGADGSGLVSDLVEGLQWIYDNRATYNIKVVNLSLNSAVPESYQTSPLSAAVEILWFNGITVVVSAGNNGTGTGPVTLYPPANDPFVITVGATDDMGTAGLSDDVAATFSAYGTTESGFAKPDLVAPGRNLISLLASTNSTIYLNHPTHRVDSNYFRMSGTSMAAPVVSGAVALLLQDEPNLTPDQVKYRLMATANKNWPGYEAAKAGAGYLDIYAAVHGTTTESANTGIQASQLLWTGGEPVAWNSVNWNSVNWNSVNWNSVNWNSVNWNSVNWNSAVWDD